MSPHWNWEKGLTFLLVEFHWFYISFHTLFSVFDFSWAKSIRHRSWSKLLDFLCLVIVLWYGVCFIRVENAVHFMYMFSVSWQVHIHKVEQEVVDVCLGLQHLHGSAPSVQSPDLRRPASLSEIHQEGFTGRCIPNSLWSILSWAFDFGRPVRYFACCKTEGSKACQMTSILCFWCWSWHPLDSFSQKDSSIWLDIHAGLSWSFQLVKYIYIAEGPMFCLS